MPILRLVILCLLIPLSSAQAIVTSLESFSVKWNDDEIRQPVLAVYAMPSEKVALEILGDGTFIVDQQAGDIDEEKPGLFTWTAPKKPGFYPIVIANEENGEEAHLNVFVMVPFQKVDKKGWLNRFRIGKYPAKGGILPPRGFIEVTPEIENIPVSPRFTVKQFLCKQAGGYPKYLVLHPYLPRRLESILDAFTSVGLEMKTLTVMSAFRPPAYNRKLRTAKLSQHQWGAAADIMVPDVNLDGRVDKEDTEIVFKMIDELQNSDEDDLPTGGLGKYRANRRHGRFLHVDVRGYEARWKG